MKSELAISALIAASSLAFAPLASAGDLTVTISDIRSAKGLLSVAVVNTEAGWNSQEKPVAAERVDMTGKEQKEVVMKFKLPAGSYAVMVMHDENGNGELDANFMGIPTEGYGFSNNPQVMRRAHFSEARFEVTDAPSAITIRLR